MTTIIEPGAQPPILVIQEEGLPLVVVQPPASDRVVVLQNEAPPLLYVAPPAPPPVIVINPILGGSSGGGGITPATFQLTSASDWYHVHDFPYFPEVRLVQDGSGVDIAVEYPEFNAVHLTFPLPFTGYVILS